MTICPSRPSRSATPRPPAPESPSSFRHHLSPTESTTDERLEPPQVVPERLGQRVEPRQGVLRPVEPHLDPGRPTDTPSARSASYALVVSVDTLNRIPVNRAGWSWAIRRASLLLGAERGPPSVLLELQELSPRERPLVADELGPEGPAGTVQILTAGRKNGRRVVRPARRGAGGQFRAGWRPPSRRRQRARPPRARRARRQTLRLERARGSRRVRRRRPDLRTRPGPPRPIRGLSPAETLWSRLARPGTATKSGSAPTKPKFQSGSCRSPFD